MIVKSVPPFIALLRTNNYTCILITLAISLGNPHLAQNIKKTHTYLILFLQIENFNLPINLTLNTKQKLGKIRHYLPETLCLYGTYI